MSKSLKVDITHNQYDEPEDQNHSAYDIMLMKFLKINEIEESKMESRLLGTTCHVLSGSIPATYNAMMGPPTNVTIENNGLKKTTWKPREFGEYDILESPHLSYLMYTLYFKINPSHKNESVLASIKHDMITVENNFIEGNESELVEHCINVTKKGSYTKTIKISSSIDAEVPFFDDPSGPHLSEVRELGPSEGNLNAVVSFGDHHVINGNSEHDKNVIEQLIQVIQGNKFQQNDFLSIVDKIKELVNQYQEDDATDKTSKVSPSRQKFRDKNFEMIWTASKELIDAGKTVFNTEVMAIGKALIPYNWLSATEQLVVKACLAGNTELAAALINIYGKNITEKSCPDLLQRLSTNQEMEKDNVIYLNNKAQLLAYLLGNNSNDLSRIVGDKQSGMVNQIALNQLDGRSEFHAQHMAFHIAEDQSFGGVLNRLAENNIKTIPAPEPKYYDEFIPERLSMFMAFSIALSKNPQILDNKIGLPQLIDWANKSWNISTTAQVEEQSNIFNAIISENEIEEGSFYFLFSTLKTFFKAEFQDMPTESFKEPGFFSEFEHEKLKSLTQFLKKIINEAKNGGYLLDIQVYTDEAGNLRVGLLEQTFTVAYGQFVEGRRTGFFELIKRYCLDKEHNFLEFMTGETLENMRACGLFGFGNFPFLMEGIDKENAKAAEETKHDPNQIESLYWAKQPNGEFIFPDPSLITENDSMIEDVLDIWSNAGRNSGLSDDDDFFDVLTKLSQLLLGVKQGAENKDKVSRDTEQEISTEDLADLLLCRHSTETLTCSPPPAEPK